MPRLSSANLTSCGVWPPRPPVQLTRMDGKKHSLPGLGVCFLLLEGVRMRHPMTSLGCEASVRLPPHSFAL